MRSLEQFSSAQLDVMDVYPKMREQEARREKERIDVEAFYRHLDGE